MARAGVDRTLNSAHMVTIRRATPADVPAAGRICYEAFSQINAAHGFPSDIDAPTGNSIIGMLFGAPGYSCWVAEDNGRVIGSNCMSEHDAIFGIGPITVD